MDGWVTVVCRWMQRKRTTMVVTTNIDCVLACASQWRWLVRGRKSVQRVDIHRMYGVVDWGMSCRDMYLVFMNIVAALYPPSSNGNIMLSLSQLSSPLCPPLHSLLPALSTLFMHSSVHGHPLMLVMVAVALGLLLHILICPVPINDAVNLWQDEIF